MTRYLLTILLLSLPATAYGQANATVPDPDPELERKTFIVAPGFEVNLFAADPLLAKPIQMNFDPQGRLWVASSEIYPQIQPGQKANDKIVILEDTKGIGKADKTTVFADGLLIPTGVLPGDGGVYVANSTELVHLSASKPGQKADTKRILLSGFGTEDTHHIIHTFRWGPDCHLYFNQSVYIHSHIETPSGVKTLNAGGIWRFNPDRTELEVFVRGFWNTWGHAFDRYGQSFITDGANGEGITHGVPGAYYPASVGPHTVRILHGLNPGSPKHCGLEIISGRHFPDDWQGDCITNDFRGHRVCRFKLQDDGSSYASREMTEVIKSNHPAFRPIDCKMGPDGALYIADWYNPIIQHGEVDFRDPRRDKTHGRIWRVTAKGRPLAPRPKLVNASIPELLEHLKDPEDWTRLQAKRVLKERGKEKVLPELVKWEETLDKQDPILVLEAMWVRIALGDRGIVVGQLMRDPRATPAVVRGLTYGLQTAKPTEKAESTSWEFNQLSAKVRFKLAILSNNPRERLEAVRALSLFKEADAATTALRALEQPMDRTLDYALWLTVRELEPYWMPEFQAGRLTFGGDAKKLAFALSAVGNANAVKPVVALIESGKVPNENVHGLWLLLAQIGGPDELGKVFAHADATEGLPEKQRAELMLAVEQSARSRRIAAPRNLGGLSSLKNEATPSGYAAIRLLGYWKNKETRPIVESFAMTDKDIPLEQRTAALEAIALYGDREAIAFLTTLSGDSSKPDLRRLAIIALAGLDPSAAAAKAADFLATARPEAGVLDLYAAFLNRKAGVPALAKALAAKKLDPEIAKLGLQAIRSSTLSVPDLANALTKAGDLSGPRKPPTDPEVKSLAADVLKLGDAVRGEAVFRRKELQCLACHGVGGAGGQVGPDLTSIGTSAQVDYLVESILLPSKAIKEGFHAKRIVTLEDKVYLGIKVREANGMIVLRNAEDKEVGIPLKDIAEQNDAKSLMPEGLTDTLSKQEFADLVRFLSELGKIGQYAPSKARVVRRWQTIEPTPANLDLFRRNRITTAAEPDAGFAWAPAYSRVSGDLSLAELPKFSVWSNTAEQSVVRFQLDVTTGGAVGLKLNSVEGLSLYVDGAPVEAKPQKYVVVKEEDLKKRPVSPLPERGVGEPSVRAGGGSYYYVVNLDLKAGTRTLTLFIDRSLRKQDVRVELEDVAGSPARVAVVGGK